MKGTNMEVDYTKWNGLSGMYDDTRAGIKVTVDDDGLIYNEPVCTDMDREEARVLVGYYWHIVGKLERAEVALAAAEAECAEWRKKAGLPPSPEDELGWGTDSERNWEALIPAADANDATRARLGLGRIGEEK